MGWRRQRSHLRVVPRQPDGTPWIDPGEADEIREQVKAELDIPENGPFPVARYTEAYNRELSRRCEIAALRRARALPVKLTASTAAAGAGGWGVAALAELLAGPAGHLIASAGTPAAALVAIGAVRLAHRARITEWRGTFRAASVGAVGWLATASALGPGWWPLLGAALVGGATVVATPWRRAHTAPLGLPAPPERSQLEQASTEEPHELDDVAAFAAAWHRLVARQNGKAPGSALADGTRAENYLQYLLTLDGQTLTQLQGRAVEIASDLDCDPMQLVFDAPPANADGWRSAKRATLRYVTNSPITRIVEYDGPRYRDGRIGLGPYADGQGWAEWVLFAEDSMYSGFVIGSTGSGKSGFLNGLVASARSSGLIVTIYLDPKVNSSPELAQTASVTALDLDRAEEFTRAVEMFLRGRRLESGINEDPGFTPTRERPGYLVVIDECDMLFTLPGMGKRWGHVAKTGRGLGLGVVGATQIDGIVACGNEEMLRSNMARHNVALMRTESASSGGQLIAPSLPSSRSLPEEPGYSYLKAMDARRAPLRAAYLPSAKKRPDGYNALVALQQNPDAPMCEIGRRAFAAFLGGSQEERRERDKALMRRELDQFLGGHAETSGRQEHVEPGGVEELLGMVPAALTADNVIPLRRDQDVTFGQRLPDELMPAAAAGVDSRLNQTDLMVLAAVYLGHTTSAAIIAHTGLPAPRVSNSGRKLAGLGYLADGGYGVWAVPHGKGVGA